MCTLYTNCKLCVCVYNERLSPLYQQLTGWVDKLAKKQNKKTCINSLDPCRPNGHTT